MLSASGIDPLESGNEMPSHRIVFAGHARAASIPGTTRSSHSHARTVPLTSRPAPRHAQGEIEITTVTESVGARRIPHVWNSVDTNVALLTVLNEKLAQRDSDRTFPLPNFGRSESIVVASDYSGEHRGAPWSCLSFLLLPGLNHRAWEQERVQIRERYRLGTRRMAFAKLTDEVKLAALPDFLAAIARQDGLLISVLLRKDIRSVFEAAGSVSAAKWGAGRCAAWKRDVLEKMLRVTHLAAFFIAGVIRSGQSVTWITDHDAIAPNPDRFSEMADAFKTILSYYLGDRRINALRCGTTAPAQGLVNLEAEDVAAIPDLAGGALVELFSAIHRESLQLSEHPIPDPSNLSAKTTDILSWLRTSNPLRHLIYTVERQGTDQIAIIDANIRA